MGCPYLSSTRATARDSISAVTCMQDGLNGTWEATALAAETEAAEAAATVEATEAADAMDKCDGRSAASTTSDRLSARGVGWGTASGGGTVTGMGC